MATDDHLTTAVDATIARAEHADHVDRHYRARWRAIYQLHHEDGLNSKQIADALREQLLARGWSDEQIAGAGVSQHSIKLAIRSLPPD